MTTPVVPFIPETAPFTTEQRAWLNGFFAGLYSGAAGGAVTTAPPVNAVLAYGSQTGTAESLAKKYAKSLKAKGVTATVKDLASLSPADLAGAGHLLLITSTHGEGEMPDNAKPLWSLLGAADAPRLEGLSYSVLGLGDSKYTTFCEAAVQWDKRLAELGAKRIHDRVDCDTDYDKPAAGWLDGLAKALLGTAPVPSSIDASEADEEPKKEVRHPAPLAANLKLNRDGSAKDTRHVAFSLEGSGLTYEAGDALGVQPCNCSDLVTDVLKALGCDGEEAVPGPDTSALALRRALTEMCDLRTLTRPLLEAFASRGAEDLKPLLKDDSKKAFQEYVYGREVIDLLLEFPSVKWSPTEFIAALRKLQHRLYSIASSPKAHPGEVHLCVGVVRYEAHGRSRKGVCSTFLSERASSNVPVFIHHNTAFRLPSDTSKPLIMIGPGTGIAPFRGFLHERKATGASGRNWLFFGDQRSSTDFLYESELTGLREEGVLHKLDLAFSRDQAEKVYVQHRMLEQAKDLYDWLEQGAHVYVCGDASRMAKDVDKALHDVVQTAGGRSSDEAAAYVRKLAQDKRYLRDVY